jgi:prepilin-type N-terminal cleavage/methylation domain-containing protein
MCKQRTAGFTLLELLVVMVLMGVLWGMLLPMLSKGHEMGRRSLCSDNMKQIHYCVTMYEQEFGMFPTRAKEKADRFTTGDAQEALNLLYRQYTDDVRIFSCPSKPVAKTLLQSILPSTAKDWPAAGKSFKEVAPGAAGDSTSYGYSPGHDSSNSRVVIVADHQGIGPKGNSDNHGKDAGQNVLSAGGAVGFMLDKSNKLGRDDEGAFITDSDIYKPKTVTPEKYPDWDSFCR